jgi:recombination protein RecA
MTLLAHPPDRVERQRALELALARLERQFGRGAIMRLDNAPVTPIAAIPTGSLALDSALGIGGLPRGRITEIYGPEASGKTTLALSVIAQAQQAGETALFIDAEHALDLSYAVSIGVDIGELLVSQPDCGEQALDIVEVLIRSGTLAVVVVDSVACLVPRAELDGEMGDSYLGLQARLVAQALRKLAGAIAKTKTAVVCCNQLREKVGTLFGNPEFTPGGRALRHHAAVRLDVRRVEALKEGTQVVGSRVRVKVVKNKVAFPFRIAELDLLYSSGISKQGSLLDLGVAHGLVDRAGASYTLNKTKLGHGRQETVAFLRDHPDFADDLEQQLRTRLGLGEREGREP